VAEEVSVSVTLCQTSMYPVDHGQGQVWIQASKFPRPKLRPRRHRFSRPRPRRRPDDSVGEYVYIFTFLFKIQKYRYV